MNYIIHYDRLIARASGRTLEGYREKHHITPRCLGGNDTQENIAVLTAREHYVAHQLLCKMHPGIGSLAIAATLMAKKGSGSRAYEWLRRRHATATAASKRGKGRQPFTLEWRQKLAAVLTAANRVRVWSPAQRARISETSKGRRHTPEARLRMSVARRGKPLAPGHAAKAAAQCADLRAVNLGSRHSAEHKAKISASLREAYRTGRRASRLRAHHHE